jgi:hypothetical protein
MVVDQRRQRLIGELGTFMRQYGRKAHPGHDPNDRRYDRGVERLVKQMDPVELDSLLYGHGVRDRDRPRDEAAS